MTSSVSDAVLEAWPRKELTLDDSVKREPASKSLPPSLVPLLALAYADGKSHNHILGEQLSADSSDAQLSRRVVMLTRIYALLLRTFSLACAQLYHIPDDAGGAPRRRRAHYAYSETIG